MTLSTMTTRSLFRCLTGDEMRTEFVCIPRPITRSDRPDGGPLRYRVVHTASLWKPGERPVLPASH